MYIFNSLYRYLLYSYNPSFLICLCFNMVSFRGQKSLGHAQIGLLLGCNSKFLMSIPTPFICGVPPGYPGLTDGLIDWLTCGDSLTGLLIQRLTDRLTMSSGDSLTGLYLLIQGLSDFLLTDWTATVDSLTALLIQGLSDWMSLTNMWWLTD